ncbi:MAG: hypothetical protein ABIR59_04475 [Gemmatimonadales bacterium]
MGVEEKNSRRSGPNHCAGLRIVDHGAEFMSRAVEDWACQRGVAPDFTRPGKPTDNGHIESFSGRLWVISLRR